MQHLPAERRGRALLRTLRTLAPRPVPLDPALPHSIGTAPWCQASQPPSARHLHVSLPPQVDPGYLSEPTVVEFETEGGLTAYMNFYRPRNKAGGWGLALGVGVGVGVAARSTVWVVVSLPSSPRCGAFWGAGQAVRRTRGLALAAHEHATGVTLRPPALGPRETRARRRRRRRLQDFAAPPGALPPLLVKIHGGPTSQASTAFYLGLQYWTSRGGGCHAPPSPVIPMQHAAVPLPCPGVPWHALPRTLHPAAFPPSLRWRCGCTSCRAPQQATSSPFVRSA